MLAYSLRGCVRCSYWGRRLMLAAARLPRRQHEHHDCRYDQGGGNDHECVRKRQHECLLREGSRKKLPRLQLRKTLISMFAQKRGDQVVETLDESGIGIAEALDQESRVEFLTLCDQ